MGSSLGGKGLRGWTPFALGLEMLARPLLPRRPHILIACMMKSGSTFLAHALASHKGLRRVRLTPAWGTREQELCELRLSRYNHAAYVSQHHLRYSAWTGELIARYGLTPVVLVRNLPDIVASLRDHIRSGDLEMPVAHFTRAHLELSDAELESAIVTLAMPWFVNFYAGWQGAPGATFVRYEDMVRDPAATLAMILQKAGIASSDESVRAALDRAAGGSNRFNKGVVGRGRDLSEGAQRGLRSLLVPYPDLAREGYLLGALAPSAEA